MNIEVDLSEIIPINQFELGWRWDKSHSQISESDLAKIKPLSQSESKRIYKIVQFYEYMENKLDRYSETDWIRANSESKETTDNFRDSLIGLLKEFDEDVLISWHRKTSLLCSKEVFINYWDDFLYPSSDDVTIISLNSNWVMIYNHIEVAKFWIIK